MPQTSRTSLGTYIVNTLRDLIETMKTAEPRDHSPFRPLDL